MIEPTIPDGFAEYKAKYPEFFPEDTPLEKQYNYYLTTIQSTRTRENAQKKEYFKKRDEQTETAQRKIKNDQMARNIYESGKFIQLCKQTFQKIWLGDSYVLEAVLYMAASFRLENADEPIHLHVAGQTQSGKSDSVKTALKFIHPSDQLTRTFSPKWIFYANGIVHENMMIFSDDTVFDKEVSALFRNILTSWHEGVKRGIVTSKGVALDLEVPRHVSLILTSLDSVCEESEDGQDESRFLTIEIRRTKDDERRIREFFQEDKPDVSPALEIIQGIWEIMPVRRITLHKKFDIEIPFRDLKRFLTLIKCHALLCNREQTTDEDVHLIDKFLSYSKPMVDSQTAAYRRDEICVKAILTDKAKSANMIASETGLNLQNVLRALRGRKGTFEKPDGGLLGKMKNVRAGKESDPPYEWQVWIDQK